MKSPSALIVRASIVVFGMVSRAEIKTVADQNEITTARFQFNNVPKPT